MERFEQVRKVLEEFGGRLEKDSSTYKMMGATITYHQYIDMWNVSSPNGQSTIFVNFDRAEKCNYGCISLYSSGQIVAKISI